MTLAPVHRLDRLTPGQVAAVTELVAAADTTDGARPLSEDAMLRLGHPAGHGLHLLTGEPTGPTGYAQLEQADPVAGPGAELVVHPLERGRGLGRTLLAAVLREAARLDPAGRLRVWAHGDHPSAAALALPAGLRRRRVLLRMWRDLTEPIGGAELPDDMLLRPFRPGDDDAAWLACNARAFASHPEQGAWTIDDLRGRLAQPWFDPAGFLLAVPADDPENGGVLGFHWTKVHTGGPHRSPIGEVYVLGIDPAAQGHGLGRALTLAGLRHLRDRGLRQAMLYVDEDNHSAVRLYRRLAFQLWSTDISYAR